MKKLLIILRRIVFLLLIAVAICYLAFFVGIPSFYLASSSHAISQALNGAQSVTLSEFIPYFDKSAPTVEHQDLVLRSVHASAEVIAKVRKATSGFLTVEDPRAHKRCFTPHHRVEITRADGGISRVDICFLCNNLRLDDSVIHTIPSPWLPRLKQLFGDLGMPSRTSEEYAGLTPK